MSPERASTFDDSSSQVFVIDQVPGGREPEEVRQALRGTTVNVLGVWHIDTGAHVDFHNGVPSASDVVTVLSDDLVESLGERHAGAAHIVRLQHVGQCALYLDRNLGHFEARSA